MQHHHTHEKPFIDPHCNPASQLGGMAFSIEDSTEVADARKSQDKAEDFAVLGKALARQLRYREALEIYNRGLEKYPDDLKLLRLRAGRYLTTLQCEKAISDFQRCLERGDGELDCRYRIALALYYQGSYKKAMEQLEKCMPLCEDFDEMGIAVIYWHTLCAYRASERPALLSFYHEGMDVGHHIGYEKVVSVCAGKRDANEVIKSLDNDHDPLEYGIALYGIHVYGKYFRNDGNALLDEILRHENFWISFAYIAAWNDRHNEGRAL